jgi:hypothetical protein
MQKNTPLHVLDKVKQELGANNIRLLARYLREARSFDGKQSVAVNDLLEILRRCGCQVQPSELQILMPLVKAEEQNGMVNFEELMIGLRVDKRIKIGKSERKTSGNCGQGFPEV